MNEALELHDSGVASVGASADVVIALNGIIHTSAGQPGVSPGEVWTQVVLLTIDGCSIDGVLEPGTSIFGGAVAIGAVRFDNVVPVPFHSLGDVQVELETGTARVRLVGTGVHLEVQGPRAWLEAFP